MSESVGLPWQKQPNEPDRWFDRFDRYARTLGHEYNIKSAYWMYLHANPQERDKAALDLWKDMSEKYDWKSRAKEWADWDKERIYRRWQERRIELLDQDWDTGATLRRTADKLLDKFQDLQEVSVMEETDPDTGVITRTVIMKPNFTIGDVARVAKVGSELQRLGVGEPTSISASAGQVGVGVYLPAIGAPTGGKSSGQDDGFAEVEDATEGLGVELGSIGPPGDSGPE